LLVDIATREIIGFAAGRNKDTKLVRTAICRADVDLGGIDIFHTDRGGEFKNEILDDIIHAFGMRRSSSENCQKSVDKSLYAAARTSFRRIGKIPGVDHSLVYR